MIESGSLLSNGKYIYRLIISKNCYLLYHIDLKTFHIVYDDFANKFWDESIWVK